MPAARDEAICLRQWDWSETSQTAALFARQLGLVRVLAKGSRRPKSAYSGGLEILTRAEIGVIVKPTSELALLTEWDLSELFPALRSTLRVHQAGLYIAELVQHAIRDQDPHVQLYDVVLECLRLLRGPEDVARVLLKLQWAVLVETGYRPVLSADVCSGEELAEARLYAFVPALGGVSAAGTNGLGEPGDEPVQGAAAWRMRPGTLSVLRAIESDGLAGLAAASTLPNETPGSSDASIDRANRLLASYLRHVLGTEPAMMGAVFGTRLAR